MDTDNVSFCRAPDALQHYHFPCLYTGDAVIDCKNHILLLITDKYAAVTREKIWSRANRTVSRSEQACSEPPSCTVLLAARKELSRS